MWEASLTLRSNIIGALKSLPGFKYSKKKKKLTFTGDALKIYLYEDEIRVAVLRDGVQYFELVSDKPDAGGSLTILNCTLVNDIELD